MTQVDSLLGPTMQCVHTESGGAITLLNVQYRHLEGPQDKLGHLFTRTVYSTFFHWFSSRLVSLPPVRTQVYCTLMTVAV